jgi:hypothetical protein
MFFRCTRPQAGGALAAHDQPGEPRNATNSPAVCLLSISAIRAAINNLRKFKALAGPKNERVTQKSHHRFGEWPKWGKTHVFVTSREISSCQLANAASGYCWQMLHSFPIAQ